MYTLETDIEIEADGSVKLLSPMPSWLKPGRTHVLLVVAERDVTEPRNGTAEVMAGVEKTLNICGGDACIAGTRVPVWALEQARRLGFTDDELLANYPSLQHHDLTAARDYAKTHTAEMDHTIRENEEA